MTVTQLHPVQDEPRPLAFTLFPMYASEVDDLTRCMALIERQIVAAYDEDDGVQALAAFVGDREDVQTAIDELHDSAAEVARAAGVSTRAFLAAVEAYRWDLRRLAIMARAA